MSIALIALILLLGIGFSAGMLVGYFMGKRAGMRRQQEGFPVQPMSPENDYTRGPR